MTDKNVAEKVKEIISEQLGVDSAKVVPEASFSDDFGADSLDIVELVTALEDQLGTRISDEDLQEIRTVKNVIDYVSNKQTADT